MYGIYMTTHEHFDLEYATDEEILFECSDGRLHNLSPTDESENELI